MSQARGRRARRPRGVMAELHGPNGDARDAAPQHLKRETMEEKKRAAARQ